MSSLESRQPSENDIKPDNSQVKKIKHLPQKVTLGTFVALFAATFAVAKVSRNNSLEALHLFRSQVGVMQDEGNVRIYNHGEVILVPGEYNGAKTGKDDSGKEFDVIGVKTNSDLGDIVVIIGKNGKAIMKVQDKGIMPEGVMAVSDTQVDYMVLDPDAGGIVEKSFYVSTGGTTRSSSDVAVIFQKK